MLPMEAADLVCLAQMGRQGKEKDRGMILLNEIVEKRNVKLYRKNYQKLQKMIETWKKNFDQNLTLSNVELNCFTTFSIEVNEI